MHSCSIRLKRIVDAVIDFLIVTLLLHLFMSTTLLDSKRPRPTLRVLLHETGSTIDIQLAPYKCGLADASFSSLVDTGFAMEGP
jgi:hypothetical protein